MLNSRRVALCLFASVIWFAASTAWGARRASSAPHILILWSDGESVVDHLEVGLHTAMSAATITKTKVSAFDPATFSGLFDIVIHANAYGTSRPHQEALVEFVRQGGIFVHFGVEINQSHNGYREWMRDLVLFESHGSYRINSGVTLRVVTANKDHPALMGVPKFFGYGNCGFVDTSELRTFSTEPATLLAGNSVGTDALAVRAFGSGHVIGYHTYPWVDSGACDTKEIFQVIKNVFEM